MSQKVFKYLNAYSEKPFKVDRLIVSSFLVSNKLKITKNQLLLNHMITLDNGLEYERLTEFTAIIKEELGIFTIENLIELFEFVISPSDRVINGAVYTPQNIREYIVDWCLLQSAHIHGIRVCDPACGCSGFLYTAAKFIKAKSGKKYKDIFRENVFGLDIQSYSVNRSKLLLTLLALIEDEENENFDFNIFTGNALSFEWSAHVPKYEGFQVIVGNPPYVCSRNMDDETLSLIPMWSVTESGHPDLYIPFFQLGYENLANEGVLGLITVNTFIKSVNGRALRKYFAKNDVDVTIINFGGEQIFKDKNTYTCLCFIRKSKGIVKYKRSESKVLQSLTTDQMLAFQYNELNHHDGWNLVDSKDKNEFVRRVESVGAPFKNLFITRNGIATLKNEIFKFVPVREDRHFYYINKLESEYPIEKGVCRKIINANKIKTENDLVRNEEQIIFPYYQKSGEITILTETNFRANYPFAYRYLRSRREILDKRDKGKVENYERWYAYGRRQSMDAYTYKLFFPHICERPTFVISRDPELLFYNGMAVISDSLQRLIDLKSLLESDIFFEYIKSTTKDYASGYISMGRNYIKNFGVPEITKQERAILRAGNIDANAFWENIYQREFLAIVNEPAQGTAIRQAV